MAHETATAAQGLNAPDFLASHVTSKGEKSFWNKVGAAWAHKDGKGFTLLLETCPINGRIVLRAPLDDAPQIRTEGRA
ncbi:hypothetical protein [Frigidibacter oleivorans]|uniref:hypothetical protein n=1 Tax=Frigidibacter oleivorans TaxID=2487129 RepID=UPI000F8C3E2B|nr:hypothetical protein [Frigidibacter oleivorans]